MKPYLLPLLVFTVSLNCSMLAPAAEGTSKTKTPSKAVRDEEFIQKAAQGGMMEVELGKLAEQKGTRADVKEYGAMMASDHGKANEELKALAGKKGVVLADKLNAKHEASVENLSKLEGAEFDRAYIDEMVKDHKTDVAEFQKAAKTTHDTELKDFIEKTLPTLKTHLQKSEEIAKAKAE